MKKKFVWVVIGAMAIGTALLGGCEKKATAQSLVEDMNAKLVAAKSYEAVMTMDMAMNIEAEGVGMDMEMSMDGNIQTILDPAVTHMDMKLEMSLLGLSMDMDMYAQVEGQQVTVYTGMAGEWMKVTEELSEDNDISNVKINVGDPSSLTLAEATTTLDGGEAYVLTGTVSGDALESVMGNAESMMEGLGDVDLDDLQADMTLWIYKETGYPASMEVVMTGDGMSNEEDGVITTISNITVKMDYTGFDTIDTIVIPEEALNAMEMSE